MDPRVRQYLMEKYFAGQQGPDFSAADQQVADAQGQLDTANKAQGIAGIADVVMNSQKKPVVLHNSMQNLGKAPTTIAPEKQKTDLSAFQRMAADKLKTATGDRDMALQLALQQRKDELAKEAMAQRQAVEGERWQKEFDQRERGIKAQAASRQAYADAMLGAKQQAAAEKKSQADAELNVPGYDRTGEVRQSPAEAKDARSAIGTANNMFKGLELLEKQMDDNGSFEWGGQAGADMATTANDLRLQAKELYNLGVLNGPDLQLMLKQIPDTESVGALFTRDATAKAQLKSTATAMKRKIEEAMKAKGYSAKAAPTGPKPGDVVDGYTFMGGDPSNPASWKK